MELWGTKDEGVDMALVAMSVAFPVEAAAIVPGLSDWFGRSQPPLRTGLGLALGFHSSADDAAKRIVEDELKQSITWVVRTGNLIGYLPEQAGSPRETEEPYIDSPALEAISVARRLQAGAEEQTADFSPVFSFLMTLLESGLGQLINYPD
jgi:hypothetical protein